MRHDQRLTEGLTRWIALAFAVLLATGMFAADVAGGQAACIWIEEDREKCGFALNAKFRAPDRHSAEKFFVGVCGPAASAGPTKPGRRLAR